MSRPRRPRLRFIESDEARRLEPLAVLRAEHETEIGQHEQHKRVEELHASVAAVGPEEPGADCTRDRQANGAAYQRANQTACRSLSKLALEADDEGGEEKREPDVGRDTDRERF